MKKLLFLILPVLLLASCQKYGDKIIQTYASQQGHWDPVKDSAGTIIKNVMVFDTLYKIVPSKIQKYHLAKEHGGLAVFYIILGISLALIVFGIIYSSGGGKPVVGIGAFVLAILLLPFAGSAIDWAVNKEVEIPKATYDSLKASPDGFKSFWDENLSK